MIYIKDYTKLVYYPYQAATQMVKNKNKQKKKNLDLNNRHKGKQNHTLKK